MVKQKLTMMVKSVEVAMQERRSATEATTAALRNTHQTPACRLQVRPKCAHVVLGLCDLVRRHALTFLDGRNLGIGDERLLEKHHAAEEEIHNQEATARAAG